MGARRAPLNRVVRGERLGGRGYWDSLCGAALCGRDASVLVIAREGRYAAIDGVLSGHASEVVTLRVFGGEAAVPASVLERALSYLG